MKTERYQTRKARYLPVLFIRQRGDTHTAASLLFCHILSQSRDHRDFVPFDLSTGLRVTLCIFIGFSTRSTRIDRKDLEVKWANSWSELLSVSQKWRPILQPKSASQLLPPLSPIKLCSYTKIVIHVYRELVFGFRGGCSGSKMPISIDFKEPVRVKNRNFRFHVLLRLFRAYARQLLTVLSMPLVI